jgi:superfamily II DNA or RNA helicase/HKD family nuclease
MANGIRGLYEVLITEALAARLRDPESPLEVRVEALRAADAADRLAFHLEQLIRRALSSVAEKERAAVGVELARKLVAHIDSAVAGSPLTGEAPVAPGTVLRALIGRRPDSTVESLPEPLIPLLDTALLTNAPGEPRVGSQILAEIPSADRIDVVMAFVRWTGLVPLLDALRRHCERGAALRVLTTTYTGSTEARALDELRRIGAEIRVSYDTGTTRLHAKAWLFHRSTGFSTAYVGSSNLTHSAQVSGLEWNVRVSGPRNPDVVNKIAAVFESYWNSGDFEPYDREVFLTRTGRDAAGGPEIMLSPIELRLEPFQERLLEQVELARQQGHHRNLLVSATGTGKTVMAAVDYARLRERLARSRLLFVAHREEILTQSLATFRHALRDASFGELWVGGRRPAQFEHVFASIQSLHAADLGHLGRDHFDVVIVDEFHHAAAPSYDRLLSHLHPRELLGLTATPERSDGLSLLHWFGGRIAAELRLWNAIDQHRLTPFVYYGISDGLDLREIPWRRGRGYDVEGLERLYTGNDVWARLVLDQLRRRIDGLAGMRALGFCVSIEHARFMARVFSQAGIAATAIWADTPPAQRRAALIDLDRRRINVLFSIDLFNEGVDLPAVDTLLLLRPTDSPTLFLQQLGRGLRRNPGKTVCTVLDFVGQHRREFRFDRRFRALLGGSRKEVEEQVERGFPFLPAGCHLELDPVARDEVLQSIRAGVPAQWTAKIEELRQLARTGEVTLAKYLEETGLEVEDVYAGSRSWTDLQAGAGMSLLPAGPHETVLRRACGRLLHVNDLVRIEAWRAMLSSEQPPDAEALGARAKRLLRMLVASVCARALTKSTTLTEGTKLLWAHPQVRAELLELLDVLSTRIDHLHRPLATLHVPLEVHARYSRIEILAAFGVGDNAKVATWQTGVYWAEEARVDLLAFTLDKTSGEFSPTTRYRDYAISRELIHWESQSTTRTHGETGRRYQNHAGMGTGIMLFARLRSDDRAFWFLGPATYVRHEGELPMSITWRLAHPLPGDLFATFAAAVA